MKNKKQNNKHTPQGEKHSWRLCPLGQYWRRAHHQKTYTKHDGTVVKGHQVSAGCCNNPSKKDQIYPDEIHEISNAYFSDLQGPPKPDNIGYENGNKYDLLIRGWVKYWNEVFKLSDSLDPDLVKALIATESSFVMTKRPPRGTVRGLMQITKQTVKILKNEKGELKDHYVNR